MNDTHNVRDNNLFDDMSIESDIDINESAMNDDSSDEMSSNNNQLDARRRLEERLAERMLEKEMREFEFDF